MSGAISPFLLYAFMACIGTSSPFQRTSQTKHLFATPNLSKCCVWYMRENQQIHQLLFNLLVMYGSSYMFRHYVAILRERS
jgi:hypothetical protein